MSELKAIPEIDVGRHVNPSIEWSESEDGRAMARPWEKYIESVLDIVSMKSHQGDEPQGSIIDAMWRGTETPYEIKYSTHNKMHNENHDPHPVSFYTTEKQIDCLRQGGMVFNPRTRIWWPTEEARRRPEYFNDFVDAKYSDEGYFIVGCIWKSTQVGEALTANWLQIPYTQFITYFVRVR